MGNRGWKKLMHRAFMNARFVCPICDKLTPEGEEKMKAVYPSGFDIISADPKHWLWTCKHCGATHKDMRESIIK